MFKQIINRIIKIIENNQVIKIIELQKKPIGSLKKNLSSFCLSFTSVVKNYATKLYLLIVL